jgi:hypothetical protein
VEYAYLPEMSVSRHYRYDEALRSLTDFSTRRQFATTLSPLTTHLMGHFRRQLIHYSIVCTRAQCQHIKKMQQPRQRIVIITAYCILHTAYCIHSRRKFLLQLQYQRIVERQVSASFCKCWLGCLLGVRRTPCCVLYSPRARTSASLNAFAAA